MKTTRAADMNPERARVRLPTVVGSTRAVSAEMISPGAKAPCAHPAIGTLLAGRPWKKTVATMTETTTEPLTHFIAYDSPYYNVRFPKNGRAYCGKMVSLKLHSNEPTCGLCKKMRDDENTDTGGFEHD